jgi:hypothetical protein
MKTVIPGFSLLEIHDQDFCSLLDMYVFRNGASCSTKEGSVFLCRPYVSLLALLKTSRHGPYRKHRSSVAVQLLPRNNAYLWSRYLGTAVV